MVQVVAIRLWPDPVLHEVSQPVTVFDEELARLVNRMASAMYTAKGIGLAAVQIGVLKRIFLIGGMTGIVPYVNPVIVRAGEPEAMPEGCLSFPRVYDRIERPGIVQVQWQDLQGAVQNSVYSGLTARVFQHELDHLNGITFDTYMTPQAQKTLAKQAKRRVE